MIVPQDVVIALAGAESAVSIDIPRGCYGAGACTFDLTADATAALLESDEMNNDAEGPGSPTETTTYRDCD